MTMMVMSSPGSMKEEYERRARDEVRVGSIMTPKRIIQFSDKTCHAPGVHYTVQEDNLSYYVVNLPEYTVVKY